MSRVLTLTAIISVVLVSLTLAIAYPTDSSAQDTPPPFGPGASACLENFESPAECDGDPAPGASSDIRTKFCIGWNEDCTAKDQPVHDSNFGGVVGFTPPDLNVPDGTSLPIGAVSGRLQAEATLGLLNGPCFANIAVAFTLMNASINTSTTISPLAPGETDVLTPLAEDNDGNNLPDGIDKYPDFLNELFHNEQPKARFFGATRIQGSWVTLNFVFFEPGTVLMVDDNVYPLDPALGTPAVTVLNDPEAPAAPGAISDFCAPLYTQIVSFGLTRDNPCTPQPAGPSGCPGQTVFENRGYPLLPCEDGNTADDDGDGKVNDGCPQVGAAAESGSQCDNTTSDDLEDSNINDGCPTVGDRGEGEFVPGACGGGDESGCAQRTNPATAGTYTVTTWVNSQRDADGDGLENSLDVCELVPNPDWDPRVIDVTNDPDNDGIPNDCDPDPDVQSPGSSQSCKAGFVGPDEDQDCFGNRQDNCPTDNQLKNPNLPPDLENAPLPVDTDSDGIGDACDPNPTTPNGAYTSLCLELPVLIGAGASTAAQSATINDDPNCAFGEATPSVVTPAPSGSVGPSGTGGPGGTGGVGGDVDTGIGTLAPTSTSISVWAIVLAVLGGIGILAGVGILRSKRTGERD